MSWSPILSWSWSLLRLVLSEYFSDKDVLVPDLILLLSLLSGLSAFSNETWASWITGLMFLRASETNLLSEISISKFDVCCLLGDLTGVFFSGLTWWWGRCCLRQPDWEAVSDTRYLSDKQTEPGLPVGAGAVVLLGAVTMIQEVSCAGGRDQIGAGVSQTCGSGAYMVTSWDWGRGRAGNRDTLKRWWKSFQSRKRL